MQLTLGQLADPLVGSEYDTQKKENFSGFIGEDEIGLFTADYIYSTRKKQELIIRKFHKTDLQLVDSKNIFSEIEDGYTNEPQEIFYQNNQFFLFSKLFSDRDKSQLLALEVFDKSLEKIHYTILDTLTKDEIQYIEESQNKDGFLLAKHLKFTQLVEQEISLLKVDRQGKIAWDKNVKSPMALQNLRIEKMRCTDDSPVYILCNYAFDLSGGNLDGEQLVNNKYAIWAYDKEQNFLKEFEIRLKEKWVNGISMRIDQNNNLLVSGYFNETKNHAINGIFSMRITNGLKVKHTSLKKFDTGTLEKFIKKDSKKKNPELDDYAFKNLCIMDDGSFYVLGEQYYKYVERSYDPRTNITTTTEHYNYNSIIASYFDSLGNHQWTERIPKAQNSTNDYGYFSSFAAMNSGEDVYLFFNDSRKNNENPPKGYYGYSNLFNNRRFQISYVHLGSNGIVSRGGLLSEEYDHMLRAKLCGQLSKDAMYLITEANRHSRIVRVGLK